MKKFFQNRSILVSLLILILVLGTLTISVRVRNNRQTPWLVQKVGNETLAASGRLLDWPLALISSGTNNVHSVLQAQQENDHLKKQVGDLAQTKARNSSLAEENSQLKKALKLQNTLTDYVGVPGSVISRSQDTWSDLLTINRGRTAGVRKNMAVMSGGGLIGRVLEADQTTAKVELITTSDKQANRFSVQARGANGRMVHGIITVAGRDTLAFTQASESNKLKRGARVYTSGLGGNSPKGLLVGTVLKTTKDSFGLSDLVQIKPAGELNDPSVVTVVERKVAK